MNDLQCLHSEWLNPFVAVLSYLRFTGIDIFDGHWLRHYLKIRYVYFVLHLIVTIQICRFLGEAISDGVNLIDVATDISYLLISLESCLLYLHFFYSLKKIKSFVSKLGEEWCDDESLSPVLIALGRKELKSFTRFNYSLNLSYLINGGMLLLTSCISQLRILFDLLQHEFRDIFNSKGDFNMEDKIKRAIRKHSRLLKLIRELSNAFGAIFALHLFLLSSVICFFGITAMINGSLEDSKNLMASIISTTTIYICCSQGQLLTDSAIDVGTATYDSEWYSLSREHKKIVLIIILRSQQITYIQSTGFTYISLTSFVKIMNMAWSFISLINGMYSDN